VQFFFSSFFLFFRLFLLSSDDDDDDDEEVELERRCFRFFLGFRSGDEELESIQ
jgi:hypothetical protein